MSPSAVDFPDLDKGYLSEFEDILNLNITDLLKRAVEENWKVEHVAFWIKVKNARNFERHALQSRSGAGRSYTILSGSLRSCFPSSLKCLSRRNRGVEVIG
ncbi:MAG: hypothetical protein FIB08_07680 [Candidatus Methanoperedens sp.]|nr:hypothetical protein [Candidatus Methanoperedens sp.]